MSLETDLLLDRRRLKRRLVFWRSLAVVALVVAILAALPNQTVSLSSAHIARLNVTGVIAEDRELARALRDAAANDDIKALIVAINSPGGSVSGGESLYRAIAAVAEKKPVVAVMGGVAASAGYMIAMPAHRVFARGSTLTGSIGVLLETGEVSGLLGKLGISAEAITSGALKDQPSLTKPLSPDGREVLHGLVMDMYEQFVEMVAAGRKMTPDQVRALADGRAYTGRQALRLGLVDVIGGEPEARDWLAEEKGVSRALAVTDITTSGLISRTISRGATGLVVSVVRRETGKEHEVKVLYDEDPASHIAPEPCVLSREGQGEASAGAHIGWPLSHESDFSRMPTGLPTWKATRPAAVSRVAGRSGVVRDPSMCGHSLPGNREISSSAGAVARRRSARGRGQTRSPR